MCGLNRVDLSYCEAQLSSGLLEYQSKPTILPTDTIILTGLCNWHSRARSAPQPFVVGHCRGKEYRDVVFMRADPRQMVPDAAPS